LPLTLLRAHEAERIHEIAYEARFESFSCFNRAFRRQFGCSPSQYRAEQRSVALAGLRLPLSELHWLL
jgi:AraC-like DNA-binding protein